MTLSGKKDSLILLFGDLVVFTLALWLALWLRYASWPEQALFLDHLAAFAPLYLVWVVVFFISDLYRRQTLMLTRNLPPMLLRAQVINSLIAVLAFYLIPYFSAAGLAPKTNLVLYLICTLPLLWLWRIYVIDLLGDKKPVTILFACAGEEVEELKREIASNPKHRLQLVSAEQKPSLIVFDKYSGEQDHLLPDFYRRFFHGTRFVAVHSFYESVFERVPISLVNEKWFLENISNQPKRLYELWKRALDLFLAIILGLISLPFYLIIWILVKLEDSGPLFFLDERIGRRGKVVEISKFRSMSTESELEKRHVTIIGGFLRRTRLDELPQLWSVIRGEQSLIGPRPERPDYVAIYREQIPYYDARHLIAPGLSGWAQLYQVNHPHFQTDLLATKEKLSYDLYYLKNRGWWLDVKIALKTIRALASRSGI